MRKLAFLITAVLLFVDTEAQNLKFTKKDGVLFFSAYGKQLVGFQYAIHYPPAGVDSFYRRSGYIHPVNTPHGQVLTEINPADHYHHYGVWNPWTKVLYEGKEYDLWNLADRKGFVRFESFSKIHEGKKEAAFTAKLQHIVNTGSKENFQEKMIMTEYQSIIFYLPGKNTNEYFFDLDIELVPATDSPVILKEYSYGGLGWRATKQWNKNNSTVLTSEGLDRKKADGSTAKWVLAEGSLGNDRGGMIWFAHPQNYNYPEPLRVWPEDSNGDGDVFINFSPTKNKDWVLEPGKKYKLRYRIIVYNGTYADKSRVDKIYEQYATNAVKNN
ncbi:PmoA family protein [Pollutibacter soli]|uniref:DUF6807 domain-containing protein n=1 Tax=Pollutibacter soli TaxID=3034157 RepID=UPI00301348A7